MVEGARLEYECAGYTAPRVRIPLSPPKDTHSLMSPWYSQYMKTKYEY